jgi:glucose 1-dehydrogenase
MPEGPEDYPKVHLPDVPHRRLLEGQAAFVTGANSGIGDAVAISLGAAGADVCVDFVGNPDPAAEIESHGSKAVVHQADVSRKEQVVAMFENTRTAFGTGDIPVNNAGLQRDSKFEDMTLAQWRKVIDVNLTGRFLCAREAVREFKRRGVKPGVSRAEGKIICMSSVHQVIPYKRTGEAPEIGRAAVRLAGDDSDCIHGISLFVDGGMTLCPGFEAGG